MTGRSESGNLPFMSYQHGSGTNEVLRPTLLTVSDGRSYRKLTEPIFGPRRKPEGEGGGGRGVASARPEQDECHLDRHFNDDEYDEGDDLDEELKGVERTQAGKLLFRMDIPEVFYKYIIGKQGKTKSTIEKDTGCRIQVPGRGRKGDVIVEGRSERAVADAKRRLEMVVWSSRLRERITHFISIPLNHPTLMERLKAFQKEVMDKCSKDEGICDEVFQIPEKFHVTVGVMRLFNAEEEEKAVKVMKECLEESISHLGSEPAKVKVQGLDCMNDDSSAVSVLFAKIRLTDSSNRLQQLVDSITRNFCQKAPDLMINEFERDTVKLHATVMNARFPAQLMEPKEGGARSGGRKNKRTFDATNVFKDFSDFEFGEVPLEVMHLSKRGEYGPDGFYKCIEKFQLSSFVTK